MDVSAGNNYMLYFVVCYGYNSVHYPFLDLVTVVISLTAALASPPRLRSGSLALPRSSLQLLPRRAA